MASVTINTIDYPTYVDLDICNEYLEAESYATVWRALTDDDEKRRAIVTASRQLDKLKWLGSRTDPEQQLEWPRSGTGLSAVLVPEVDLIPQRIVNACCILAAQTAAGVDYTNQQSTASGRVKRQAAGSVSIEYFRDTFDVEGVRLPLSAWELIQPYISGSGSSLLGALASGTDTGTRFTDENRPIGGYAVD